MVKYIPEKLTKGKKGRKNTAQDAQTKPACSTSVNNGFCPCHHHQEENIRTPAG